jgi:hypothetical protein
MLAQAAGAQAAAAPPASGDATPDWREVIRTGPAGGAMTMAYDLAAARRDGDLVRTTLRAQMEHPGRDPSAGLFALEMDCRAGRFRITRTTNFDSAGAPVYTDTPKAKFIKIKPGTWYEKIRAGLC